MSRPNKSLNNDRVICLVSREVLDILECDCRERIANLVKEKEIPHMYIYETENFFVVKLDRACQCVCEPCDRLCEECECEGCQCECQCEDRYEQFKMEKDKLRQFLIAQDAHWKTVHDTEWY